MFLFKLYNGVYYLWYTDEAGKRQKTSTKTNSKVEVQRFLRDFIQSGNEKKTRQSTILLSHFQAEFLYSASSDSPKTTGGHLERHSGSSPG